MLHSQRWAKGDTFKLRVINADMLQAICGNEEQCTGSHAIQRTLGPKCTSTKVRYHKVCVVYDGWAYRFALPDAFIKMQRLNDAGEITLGPDRFFNLDCCSAREVVATNATRERKDQINAARAARVASGNPDATTYSLRREAAIKAGKADKRALKRAA